MHRLLEETLLFDISAQQIPVQYGEKWELIQAQMKKIITLDNIKTLKLSPKKVNHTSRSVYDNKKALDLSPNRKTTYLKENRVKETSKFKQNNIDIYSSAQDFVIDQEQREKRTRIENINMIKKLELTLLDQNSLLKQKQKINNKQSEQNINQKRFYFAQEYIPYGNFKKQEKREVKKEVRNLQNQNNPSLAESQKNYFNINGQNIPFKQRLNNIQDSSKLNKICFKSQKFDFQSLGKVLSTKNAELNSYLKRRSSIQNLKTSSNQNIKNLEQKILIHERRSSLQNIYNKENSNASGLNKRNSETKKSQQFIQNDGKKKAQRKSQNEKFRKQNNQEKYSFGQFKKYKNQFNEKLLKEKIKFNLTNGVIQGEASSTENFLSLGNRDSKKNKNMSQFNNETKANNQSKDKNTRDQIEEQENLYERCNNLKSCSEYKQQIDRFKQVIFKTQLKQSSLIKVKAELKPSERKSMVTEHIQFPQIKNLSNYSKRSSERGQEQKDKQFNSTIYAHKMKSRLRTRSEHFQRRSLQMEQNKIQQINLIIKKEKQVKNALLLNNKKSSSFKHQHSKSLREEAKIHNQAVQKITLSSLINGKVRINQLTSIHINKQKIKTNLSKKQCEKTRRSLTQNSKQNETISSTKQEFQIHMKNGDKRKRKISQHQIDKRNFLICENIRIGSKLGKCAQKQFFKLKTKKLYSSHSNFSRSQEQQISANSKNCQALANKLLNVQKCKQSNFQIKKNLDAEKNISLIKLSLNKNKNKLVIVRK